MRHKSAIFVFLMAVGLVLTSFSADSAAYTFSLKATSDINGDVPKTTFNLNEVFYLFIELDNANGVAGAAFTLNYPSTILTAPVTDAEGVSSDITSPFPFTFETATQTHRGNSTSTLGKIYLAGAAIDTSDGGSLYVSGQVFLFRIKFTVKGTATPGSTIPISLQQTVLTNTGAGYNNEPVKVLVGAVDNTHANWLNLAAAFPNLLPSPPSPLAQKNLFVNDNDSIDNQWEFDNFGDLSTATNATDYDGDGYLDRYEQPAAFGGNNTNPKVDDPPYTYPNYNPATDTRGPYQVVATDPVRVFAQANAGFDMDVNYFTSSGAQNLSGLTLRIHYDSSKLTWNSFSGVLATGLVSQDSSPQNDQSNLDGDASTDKYLTVLWSGGNWPGVICTQASPARLYTVGFTVVNGVPDGTTSTIRFTAVPDTSYTFWSVPVPFEARAFQRGDVTLDGNITPADATGCFQLYLTKEWSEMTELERFTADYNNSGSVTPADATAIFQHYLNQP
jgi:hypothetical protein